MKKETRFLAVLSTAAVMAFAAPVFGTGMAGIVYAQEKTGWVEESAGEWKYYDSDGYMLTDSWKKQGNDWYYLDEDGSVAVSRQVDEYYVDESGKRVSDTWLSVDNDEWFDDAPMNYWFYYGKNGKMVTDKWMSIDGQWYYFDGEGHMLTGLQEVGEATYYFGDDGARKYGWFQLEETDESLDREFSWFYFDKSGKMLVDETDKKIGDAYYTFADGRMQTGWVLTDKDAAREDSAAGYQYYGEDGKRASGWLTIVGVDGVAGEDEEFSFYFKNGKPYCAETGIQVFSVNSKKYGFNTRGEMQTGLQTLTREDGSTGTCYFGEDGVMRVGRQTIYDEDLGENQVWYFSTDGSNKGIGYTGIRDNVIYDGGLRLEADADLRLAPVTFEDKQYLVNVNGQIQKASSTSQSKKNPDLGKGFKDYEDLNDKIWTVDTQGIIQQ